MIGWVLIVVALVVGFGNVVHAMAGSPWYRIGWTITLAVAGLLLATVGTVLT